MKFLDFIDPGGSKEPPAIAPGVAVRASMEIVMIKERKYKRRPRPVLAFRVHEDIYKSVAAEAKRRNITMSQESERRLREATTSDFQIGLINHIAQALDGLRQDIKELKARSHG